MLHLKDLLAMRRLNPEGLAWMLAYRHVERGRDWLCQNAPFGWRRNLFTPRPNGRSWFRCRDSYDNECVLALAFESRRDLANDCGYVTFASVVNGFKLWGRARLLGFASEQDTRPGHVTGAMLDTLWEYTLTEDGWNDCPIRYWTPKEEAQFRELLAFVFLPETPRWIKWLRNVLLPLPRPKRA